MPRFAYLCRSIIVTGLLYGAACSGRGPLSGAGGTGGTGDAAGEPSDASDAAPITSCPASSPMLPPSTIGPACDGTFSCGYPERCRCGICCETYYDCENGHLQYVGSGDACQSTTPCDAGASTDASTGV